MVSSYCRHKSIQVRGTASTELVVTTLLSGKMYKLHSCLVDDFHGIGFHIFQKWLHGRCRRGLALWLVIKIFHHPSFQLIKYGSKAVQPHHAEDLLGTFSEQDLSVAPCGSKLVAAQLLKMVSIRILKVKIVKNL